MEKVVKTFFIIFLFINIIWPQTSGLVVYYPFNGNANDASGNNLNGTVDGAVLITDRFINTNSAYSFDGVDDNIEVADNALLDITSQISLVAWIYPTAKKSQEILRKGPNVNPSPPYELALSGTGMIMFELNINGVLNQLTHDNYALNEWSLIVGTYDGSIMRLYVNGVLKVFKGASGEISENNEALLIGTRLKIASSTFQGKLDDIRIYNRALTQQEIDLLTEILYPPELISPLDNSFNADQTPTFNWSYVVGASRYDIQVDNNSNFSSPKVNTSTDLLLFTASTLKGGKYYWRIRSKNENGESAWTGIRSFEILTIPTLILPENDAIISIHQPTFRWTGYAHVYYFELSTDEDFNNIVKETSAQDTIYQLDVSISSGTYYWRVKSFSISGDLIGKSAISKFNMIDLPSNPVLNSPSNNASGISTNPILSWDESFGADTYGLQVSRIQNFSTTVYNHTGLTNTSQQVNGLNEQTKYYWRVNAANAAGTSSWSDVWSFTTEIIVFMPSTPTLVSPSDGSSDVSTSPVLMWNTSSGADSYGLQVSTSSNFNTTIYNQTGLTNTSQQVSELNTGSTYYWRVNATNTAGTSSWSEIWSFTTETSITSPQKVTLALPSNGASGISNNLTLSWNTPSGALSYGLQVSTLSNFNNTIFNQTGLTSTSQQISNLDEKTTYYWRVNATNTAGTSDWSDTWHFTTEIATTISQPVTVTGISQNAYRIISIPVDADNKSPSQIFSDFGSYDKTKWRLFEQKNDGQYNEYSDIDVLSPGKGYWLITKMSGKKINTGSGKTIRTDQSFSIPVDSGWTLIGNPFMFPVPLLNLSMENGAELDIRTYTGDWQDFTGSLQPFEGYLVGSESATNLLINPNITSPKIIPKNLQKDDPEWQVSIHAQCQQARDTYTIFGVHKDASIDLDNFDKAEPPVIGEYVSVYFPHQEWNSVFKKYGKDFRPDNAEGYIWEFAVRTNINDKVRLIFTDINKISKQYDIWLYDEIAKHVQRLRETNQYEITCSKNPKILKLLVGKQDFINSELNKMELLPQIFFLDQNFPNPFNPSTIIRFGIPSERKVTIKIYNILGQEITTLLNNVNKPSGYHSLIWNGTNKSGRLAPSGIYLCSLEAGSYKAVNKMVLIR